MSKNRKFDGQEIKPQPGSRNGWSYSSFKRVGRYQVHDDRRTLLYGVYGAKRLADGVSWLFYLQYEGEHQDGVTTGLSLQSSSADLEVYFWAAAIPNDVTIFVEDDS